MNDNKTLKDIINEVTEQEIEENCPELKMSPEEMMAKIKANEKVRKKKRLGYIAVAAVLIVAFVVMGVKFGDSILHVDADRNGKEEILTDEGVIVEDKGWGSSGEAGLVITDWEEIYIAKEHVEDLLVPGYIPKGYEFEELKIENVDGGNTCTFTFSNKTNVMEVRQYNSVANMRSLEMGYVEEKVTSKKGNVYIRRYDENKIATIRTNDGMTIELDSNLKENEIVKIIENLN